MDENSTIPATIPAEAAPEAVAPPAAAPEPPKLPVLTQPEEIAKAKSEKLKAKRDADQARADELGKLKGKPFRRLDGKPGTYIVVGYGGIGVARGVESHTLIVEGAGIRWTPPAKEFLEQYEEITTA